MDDRPGLRFEMRRFRLQIETPTGSRPFIAIKVFTQQRRQSGAIDSPGDMAEETAARKVVHNSAFGRCDAGTAKWLISQHSQSLPKADRVKILPLDRKR